MHALSTLNLNQCPAIPFRKLTSSSAKLKVPSQADQCLTSTMMRLNRSSGLLSLNNRAKLTKVAVSGVSDVMSPEEYKDVSELNALEVVNKIEDYVVYIRERLSSIGEGRISVSPYDTACVALIKDDISDDKPLFPSTLNWIANNQLTDGSWGDEIIFNPYDRLLNTLACVVALRSWNAHLDKAEKGISFIKENVHQRDNISADYMTVGFEIVFPSFLQRARNLGIDDIPHDAPFIKDVLIKRDQKLERIPKEKVDKISTSLLYSLEGLENLNWQKLLKLQTKHGSFLSSPASTAFAYMETKDENCLKYIKNILGKFNGEGVPNVYPVDLFARHWAVDRIQRLGISRYFETEIKQCLSYTHSYWTSKGVSWGRELGFTDSDDTSMAFRLLRMHGFEVNPDVFKTFKSGNEFKCIVGELNNSLTAMFALYKASQLLYPGETIMEEAKDFSRKFLQQRVASDQLHDKWLISNSLPDEIRNALEIPWYANLPRVEASIYIGYYAHAGDVWIGKVHYRMYDVSNNTTYLELARLDFNRCQAQHQIEWILMQEWYDNCNAEEFGITKKDLLYAFFLATASIFEPERLTERIAWAKTQIISKIITSTAKLDRKVTRSLKLIRNNTNDVDQTNSGKRDKRLLTILQETIHQFLEGFDEYTSHQLTKAWEAWLFKLPQCNDQQTGELIATTLNICAGHVSSEEILHPEYQTLVKLTNQICQRLSDYQIKVMETGNQDTTNSLMDEKDIQHDMQTLVQLVLQESGGINRNIKQTFLMVAKTHYYTAYTAAEKTQMHISKVLFEPVV